MAEKAAAAVIDFSGVKDRNESGINKKRVQAGDYLARVTRVEDRPVKETKAPQWMYVLSLETVRGTGYPYYCKLEANQLWKVRNLFLAAGIAIPKKKVRLDPNKVVGKLVGVTMEDDEYDGKLQSVIAEIFPASELNDDGDSNTSDDEDSDEEYDEDEEGTEEEEPEDEEEADEEEDEEEPEPEPAPRRRAPAKKAAPAKAKIPAQRKASPAVDEVDEDELDELDIDSI